MIELMPPYIIFFLSALVITLLPKKFGDIVLVVTPIISLIHFFSLQDDVIAYHFLDQSIKLFHYDRINLPFFYVFLIIAFIGIIYNLHSKDKAEKIFPLIYGGSSLGLVFAGDFLSLFFFWELMAVFSTFIIWQAKNSSSKEAGLRYLLIHLLGGFFLLSGIILIYKESGLFSFNNFNSKGLSSYLILVGFLINAASIPFSAWLPDSYPQSTIGGSVFLSAYTTKSAVYVLIRFFSGFELLIILGSLMAVYGVIYAFMVLDMRRLLSYHIISQVGFMVVGVGLGSPLAINGAISHAFTHIIYKGLLFMSVGAIIYSTGKERLNELGGLLSKLKNIFIFYAIGALSISGAPLLSGFVSKSLTITASQEEHNVFAWLMLNLASTGTFISVALKLPYLAFFSKKKEEIITKSIPTNMTIAMFLASSLCLIIGIYPNILYQALPYKVSYEPYTIEHIIFVIQLFLGGFVAFTLYLKNLDAKNYYIILDTDWFYRKGTRLILKAFYFFQEELNKLIEKIFYRNILKWFIWFSRNPLLASKIILESLLYILGAKREEKELKTIIEKYPLDMVKHWPIGTTVLYVTFFLLLYLLIYYLN